MSKCIHDLADDKGTAGKWRSSNEATALDGHNGQRYRVRNIFHYSTLMLAFGLDASGNWDGNVDTVYASTGYGSVSDQNGMNKLFARQAMPFSFSRAGGARINTLQSPHYRYRITREDLYAKRMRSVTVDEVINTWPTVTI